MNRNQFISYMDNPDKLSGNESIMLAELVKNFPYFQTAHLLYAKSLHNEHSIHYNNQLKIAATYATDRKILHRLITKPVDTKIEVVNVSEIKVESENKKLREAVKQIVIDEVNQSKITPIITGKSEGVNTSIEIDKFEKVIEKTIEISVEKIEIIENTEQIASEIIEISIDQPKVIEKTAQADIETKEIALERPLTTQNVEEVTKELSTIEPKVELIEKNDDLDSLQLDIQGDSNSAVFENVEEVISDELEKEYLAQAAISKIELEVLNTEFFTDREKLSESKIGHEFTESNFVLNIPTAHVNDSANETSLIEKTEPNVSAEFIKSSVEVHTDSFDSTQTHSFTEWLKNASNASGTAFLDNKSEEKGSKKATSDLIDDFLREQPKMSKPKTEFYNPVNMAKQSVAEDITFVSETLAKIFMLQGNYIKALQAYENLRLKYPEKRLYFAAQIKNLKKLINQQKQ